jgi:hypothetical protein
MPAEIAEKKTTVPAPVFAHESEEEVARLLDFYEVRWEYEPRTFPLEWDEDGRITRQFTPDFYLPDYDMFLEITTIQPSLKNRKNRKIRRFRELYPETPIRLLAYKDIEALIARRMGSS